MKQLRKDYDDFVEDLFFEPGGQDPALIGWANIGATALEWGIQNDFPISMAELHKTLVRKQRDYGHDNIRRFGRQGLMVRMHDKIARLENLLASGHTPGNESIADTVMDIAGYAAIGIMWESENFLLPLEENSSPGL